MPSLETKPVGETSLRAARIRLVIGCSLAQNAMLGIAYGSFGPLLAANEAHFGVGRAVAATGMSVVSLMMALVAALAGGVIQRFQLRDVMIFGVLIAGASYISLSFTNSLAIALVCYAFIGAGVALAAILTPLTLVTRWIDEGRGKALSIVNLPLALFGCPFIIGEVLPQVGRDGVVLGLGCVVLAMVPLLLLLIREHPPVPARMQRGPAAVLKPQPTSAIIRSAAFWLVSLGIGLMAGSGVVFVVHIVAFGTSNGMSVASATWILSVYAAAGLVGTPFFGWLADKLSPPNALVVNAACQAVLWSLLLILQGPSVYLVAACLGMCATPLIALHGAALSVLFGKDSVARAVGCSYVLKLPFLFGFAPAAGALFEMTGDYHLAFLLCSAIMVCSTLCFVGLSWVSRSPRRPLAAGA